ncbi:hypothetical protein AWC24_15250 [Mycolicibacter senuensis]|uniref:Uncharacterized protein n=1 Tax=Mycolicibacter senuensis TaxID=386913 RepID=A0A7I9XMC0_9MYCO|nr:hypothetical protein AWC24_15250 [Mycolicibacter senuensis]GFG71074.1 hypothetical protein MSEN_27940 [Mycolicibacter senuensis]
MAVPWDLAVLLARPALARSALDRSAPAQADPVGARHRHPSLRFLRHDRRAEAENCNNMSRGGGVWFQLPPT